MLVLVTVLVLVTALSLPLYSPLSHLLSTCLLLLTQSLRFRYIISIITDSIINQVFFLVISLDIEDDIQEEDLVDVTISDDTADVSEPE